MHYLYAYKQNGQRKLVATFGSEQQLLAYVRWATLESQGNGTGKFEQGSVLASYQGWERASQPLDPSDTGNVVHNPTPSML